MYDPPVKRLAVLCPLLLVAAACGDNNATPDAFRHIDGPPRDTHEIDAPEIDAPTIDTPTIDTPTIDTPTIDAMIDAPAIDAMIDASIDASATDGIAAAIATPDGTGLTLPITGVTVTYIKPQIGSTTDDPAGFTVQSMAAGPALFVAVDPTTLTPMPAVGDVVSFTVTSMTTVALERRANAVTAYARSATGANVNALATDLSGAADVVTNIQGYDARVVNLTGMVASALTSGGSGFLKASITSTGIPVVDPNFTIRLPSTVADQIDLVNTCGFTLHDVPVGLFGSVAGGTTAEISPYAASDITLTGCPAPVVSSAVALSSTSVKVTFSRNVLAASVTVADFTIDNGLTVSAVAVSGRTVTLTTSAQTPSTTYTVTVAGVTDLQGTMLGATATAMFTGYSVPAVVRINELNANITGNCDLVELRVISGGPMINFRITERNGGSGELNFTIPTLTVATNDIIVIHEGSALPACNPGTALSETTSITQYAQATYAQNYDTAWDLYTTDPGLTNTDNVITLYDGTGAITDAVFVANSGATIANATGTAAAVVGTANQWSPAQTTYTAAEFHAAAVTDLGMTGNSAAGASLQRINDADTNASADWNTGGTGTASSWGVLNAGQTAL